MRDAKVYLDYLDKEMTIMGVLSAFCVATISLTLYQVLGGEAEKSPVLAEVWERGHWLVISGSCAVLFAALSFYRQRSLLAWHYGQLAKTITNPDVLDELVDKHVVDADAWDTWILYRWGFGWLSIGVLGYAALSFPSD